MAKKQLKTKQFFILIFLLLLLPVLIISAQTIISLLGQASGIPANLAIDYNSDLGPINKNWQALAQGGEEKSSLLTGVVNDIRNLSPRYIRIDHIYDLYEVVKRNGDGSLDMDFSRLDIVVDDILTTGALPFISLSYMPSAISGSDVTGGAKNWAEWRFLIQKSVEHYSGREGDGKNLSNVYYEVWNEPDLFGSWKTYGSKNYLDLYRETVIGAGSAGNVNSYKIGGPATTGFYPGWMKSLLEFCRTNSLRIDFLSYHRYTKEVEVFANDLGELGNVLNEFPEYQNLEIIISEWGSDPENNPIHDTNFDAIHAIAAIRKMIDKVNLAFTFEIKDGPGDQEYWGRWGLITHDKFGLHKKPKYYAISFLNRLDGQRLRVDGEGTHVMALSTKNGATAKVLVVNYDSDQQNRENVPLLINNLPPANYSIKISRFQGQSTQEYLVIDNGNYSTNIDMPSQSAVILEITKLLPSHTYSLGYFGGLSYFGLRLNKNDLPFLLSKQEYDLTHTGTMEFLINPKWDENTEDIIWKIVLDGGRELQLKKTTSGFQKRIEFGLFSNEEPLSSVSIPINWQDGQWHHLVLVWSASGFSLNIDGIIQTADYPFDFNLAGDLIFNNFGGVLDELRILNVDKINITMPDSPYIKDNNTLILKHFDRSIE